MTRSGRRNLRRYTIFGEKSHYDAYWREVNETKTRDRVVARLKALGAPAEELALIEKAKANSDALIKTKDAAMKAVAAKDFDTARKLIFDENYDRNKAVIMEPIAQFQTKMNARAQREAAAARQHAETMTLIAEIMVGLTAAIFAGFMYGIFGRRVVAPVVRISGIVTQLANQDYSVTITDTERQDEIGDMTKAIHVFRENGAARQRLEAEQQAEREAKENRARAIEALIRDFDVEASGILGAVAKAAFRAAGRVREAPAAPPGRAALSAARHATRASSRRAHPPAKGRCPRETPSRAEAARPSLRAARRDRD